MKKITKALIISTLGIQVCLPIVSYATSEEQPSEVSQQLSASLKVAGVPESENYKTQFSVKPSENLYKGSMTFRPANQNELLIDGFVNNNNIQIAITVDRTKPRTLYIYELSPNNSTRQKYTLTEGSTVNSKEFPGHRYVYPGGKYDNIILERYNTRAAIWNLKRTLLQNDTKTVNKVIVPIIDQLEQETHYIIAGTTKEEPENQLLESVKQSGFKGDAYTTGAPETIVKDGVTYALTDPLPINANGYLSKYYNGWSHLYNYGNYDLRRTQIDDSGTQLIELLRKNGTVEQSAKVAAGQSHTFPNKGTAGGSVTAVNFYNGIPETTYHVVYQYIAVETEYRGQIVDQDGNKISKEGLELPSFEGKRGETIQVNPEDLPEIPGYIKPSAPLELVIPETGSVIEIPYERYIPYDPDNGYQPIEITEGKSNNKDYNWYFDHQDTGGQLLVNAAVMAEHWYHPGSTKTVGEAEKSQPVKWDSSALAFYMFRNKVPFHYYREPTLEFMKNEIDEGRIFITYVETSELFYNPTPDSTWGRFYEETGRNNIIVKGYKYINNRLYFETYDPLSGGRKHKNGEPLGKDRLYDAEEFMRAMEKGVPIIQVIG
ncbi:hypothetical protein G8B08_06605 [Enterococcus faecalis]|uniref:DUF5978 domain-containing protein n=1 Tax=Enterococcus faecalis TaxID=1351 RepID=UPI0018836D12|nr:hypothetical protein [Enterococcus faecalis]EHL0041996.1 hypothetical protein [Enterococcus faecalis]MBE9919747.1 hypothetical protein [Enterococcus faecalis]